MPQLEVNTNQKNTHWTWAERTYGRQQQIIWAVFFQTNYIAQTLVKETRDNIADLIILAYKQSVLWSCKYYFLLSILPYNFLPILSSST